MDPVSLCASLLTLISAAQGVAKGLRKLREHWRAPQLLQEVVAEVESLQCTLRDVSAFIASSSSSSSSSIAQETSTQLDVQSLCEPVARAAFAIQRIDKLISSSPTALYAIRLRDANHARVTWMRRKNEIKGLLDGLKVVRMDLMVRLGLLAASSIARIEESVNASMRDQSRILQSSSIAVGCHSQGNNSFQLAVQEPPQEQVQEDSFAISNTLPSAESGNPHETVLMTTSSIEVISRATSAPLVQTCPAWCGCKCHVRYQFRSPWILEAICGRIDIQYSGQLTECNEKKCRGSVRPPFSIKYHFPQYLISRYVVFKMFYSTLDGPTFALRAPRVIEQTSLLWHYILRGDLRAVQKMFSEHKASPYDVDVMGCNVSIFAVNLLDCRVSQFLIQQGADPTLPNQRGRTASELLWDRAFAGQFGDESQSIVRSLLNDSEYMEGRNFSVLHKIVLSLVNRDLQSELELSTALLDCGDATHRTPLIWAVIRDEFEMVTLLLAYGADPNIVDDLGFSPLHFVQSSRTCEALLNAGANISLKSYELQKSPLHGACYSRPNLEVIDVLVNAGIPVDVPDVDKETPLMRAIYASSFAEAERFMALGANVNGVKPYSGKSPILIAIHRDMGSLILPLLARGADYMAVTTDGENIAHLAAELATPQTFDILTESCLHGLDTGSKTKHGKTPADLLAERAIFEECAMPVREALDNFIRSVAPIGHHQ